jgi:hypothetical protein
MMAIYALALTFGTMATLAFKRLKGDDSEFVCVSFRDWACYQSPNLN